MKPFFTLFLLVSVCYVKSQVAVNAGTGLNNKGNLISNIQVDYQLKKMNIGAGYLVSLTDCSNVPDLIYLKGGRKIKLNRKAELQIGGGFALHSFKLEKFSKVDQQYSSFKTIYNGKPLVSVHYQQRVISDGAFYSDITYSGNMFYGGIGLTYFFKKKKKPEKIAVAKKTA